MELQAKQRLSADENHAADVNDVLGKALKVLKELDKDFTYLKQGKGVSNDTVNIVHKILKEIEDLKDSIRDSASELRKLAKERG